MNRFEHYLIVSDMDGTFFGEGASILQNNLEAIDFFRSQGGKFTFATGRDYKILEHQYPELCDVVSCPAVLCNGSYLYDFQKKEKSFEIELDKNEVLRHIQEIERFIPEATFRISCDLGYLCSEKHQIPFPKERILFFSPILTVGDLQNFKKIPWHKLVYSANGMENAFSPEFATSDANWIPKVEEFAKSLPFQSIHLTTSSSTLLEFLPKGASKGKALKNLKTLFPNRTIICVGDYQNDMDMLLSCDIPACPENALPEVKAISKIHLCHHREGCIADLIYKLDSIMKK